MIAGSERFLESILSDLEKKRKAVWVRNGIVSLLLILFVSLATVSVLSYAYTNSTYFSVLKLLGLLALFFGFIWFLVPALLKKEKKSGLALELNSISPGLGEDALNAILLADETNGEKELGVSKSLVAAHIDEVARKIESLDLSTAVPQENIRYYWKHLAAVFVLSVVALIFAPRE
ncbi:MAG TPA: hypothetical protein VLB01_05335, partial [Thermodesulfobacteriota bacterium]|nr:hypothetical protein [Thermodesulfobacteriota bacterium]